MARRRRHRSSGSSRGRGSFARPLSMLMPAVVGAGGALAVNALVNYTPLPDSLKSGNMVYVTRLGIAVALGMFGPRLPIIGKFAADAARGSLIVTMTDYGKSLALAQGYNLSGLGYANPGRVVSMQRRLSGVGNGAGMYVGPGAKAGMGAYVGRR